MSQSAVEFPRVETYDYALFGPVEVQPLNNVRRIISRRLSAAWANVPQVAQFDELDLTELEALRRELKPKAAAQGTKLTILPFIVKACIRALQEFPAFNASLDETGENLILKKYYNIAFAADTPAGLLAPVLKNADRKSIFEIAIAISELARKAREGKLAFSDCEGGCFSISNLGVLGGTGFTPTINAPEVAMLGVASAREKPIVIDGQITTRLILPLTLSYDHRVIDGAVGGRFMQSLRQSLTAPRNLVK